MINPLSAIMAFVVLVVYVVKERTSSAPARVAKPKEESSEKASSRPTHPNHQVPVRPFAERPQTPAPMFSRSQERLEESSFGLRSRSNLRPKTKEVGTQSFIEAPSMTVEEPSVVGKAAMCCGACLSALALRPLKKVFKMAGEQAIRREKSQRRGKSDRTDRILDNFSDEEGSNSISRKRLLANRALRESAAQGKITNKLRDELHSDFKDSVSPPSSNQFRHREAFDKPAEPTHVPPPKTMRELSSFTPESKEIPEPSKTNLLTSNPFAPAIQNPELPTSQTVNLFTQNSNETEKKNPEMTQPQTSLFPKTETSATNLFPKTETSTANPFAKTESQPPATNLFPKSETAPSLFSKTDTQTSNPFAKSEPQPPFALKAEGPAPLFSSTETKPSLFPSGESKAPLFPSAETKAPLFPSTESKAPLFPSAETKAPLFPKAETATTNPFAAATATPASNPFAAATTTPASNPFATAQTSNPFSSKPTTGVSEEVKPKENPFAPGVNSSNLFDSAPKTTPSPFAVPSPATKPDSAPFTSSGTAPLFGNTSASALFPQTTAAPLFPAAGTTVPSTPSPLFPTSSPAPVLDTKGPLFPMSSNGGQNSSPFSLNQDARNVPTPSLFAPNPFATANSFQPAKPAETGANFFQTQNVSSGTQVIPETNNPFAATPTPSSNPFQPNPLFGQTPPSANPNPSSENSFFSKAVDANNSNPFINSVKNQNKHGLNSLIGSGSNMFSK